MFNFEYIGNLHIHSTHSDGAGNLTEITRSAGRAGLDFICMNDHDFLSAALHLEEEGLYEGVLVLVGMEIGERFHHYLAYDLKEIISSQGLSPQQVIDQVRAQGGFGFLAHPFEKGMPFRERSVAYTWNDLSVTGYTGICVWNFTSRWKERIKTAAHGLIFLAFKTQSLKPPSKKTLAFWDDMCQQRRVVAIGGSDAHAWSYKWGRLNFRPLSYDYLFKTINIHILLDKNMPKAFEDAKKEVYGAMKEGRLFIAHDNISPARGFRFYFVSHDGTEMTMGGENHFEPGELVVKLPRNGEIRLFRNGNLEKRWRSLEGIYRVQERGVYRIEVYRRIPLFGWRPWIFSNPIYLR